MLERQPCFLQGNVLVAPPLSSVSVPDADPLSAACAPRARWAGSSRSRIPRSFRRRQNLQPPRTGTRSEARLHVWGPGRAVCLGSGTPLKPDGAPRLPGSRAERRRRHGREECGRQPLARGQTRGFKRLCAKVVTSRFYSSGKAEGREGTVAPQNRLVPGHGTCGSPDGKPHRPTRRPPPRPGGQQGAPQVHAGAQKAGNAGHRGEQGWFAGAQEGAPAVEGLVPLGWGPKAPPPQLSDPAARPSPPARPRRAWSVQERAPPLLQHCFCGVRRLRRLRPPIGNRHQMLQFFQRARGQREVCRMYLDMQWMDGHPASQQQVLEASSVRCPVKDYSLGFPSSRGEPWHPLGANWCKLLSSEAPSHRLRGPACRAA
ncbi:uncharacterized protein [Manis javanica]|uniref:uncharacterized protein n=1 Tax=Manis javanica TaxID=9974 RepID=UPI003C6DB52F